MKLQFYISAKIIRKSTEQIIYTLDTSISLEVQTLVSKQINNFTFLTTHRSINKLSDIFDVLARGDRTYVGVAVHIEQISLPLLEWAKAGWVPSDQILAAILDVAVAAATQATTAVTAIHTLRTEADTGTEITGQKQHYQQIHQRCALAWIRTPKAFSMVKTLCLEFIAIGGGKSGYAAQFPSSHVLIMCRTSTQHTTSTQSHSQKRCQA